MHMDIYQGIDVEKANFSLKMNENPKMCLKSELSKTIK